MFNRLAWASMLLATSAVTTESTAAAPRLEALDSINIPAEGANGVRIEEFSGLAWDEDEQLLYAVSDGGVLHHFRLRLNGLRIEEIQPVFSAPIAALTGGTSAERVTNAEGLTVLNHDNGERSDSELLVAFEDGPAIVRFTPQGNRIVDIALPGALADERQYRKKNSRLEAVEFDRLHGVLTAPEQPLEGQPEDRHTIYAADGTTWSFAAFQPDSRLKAIQELPDGNLLILERTRDGKGGTPSARLRYLDLTACSAERECPLIELSARPDAMLVNNFEGLARLSGDLFLMVTDKTKKDSEPTTFVLFKVTTGP
ncbi:esterase-like activity of phytase family protein (plasmid) [Ensifer sp. D2-11]